MTIKINKSLAKFFRTNKARIRRDVCDLKEQKELIEKLYSDKGIVRTKGKTKEG